MGWIPDESFLLQRELKCEDTSSQKACLQPKIGMRRERHHIFSNDGGVLKRKLGSLSVDILKMVGGPILVLPTMTGKQLPPRPPAFRKQWQLEPFQIWKRENAQRLSRNMVFSSSQRYVGRPWWWCHNWTWSDLYPGRGGYMYRGKDVLVHVWLFYCISVFKIDITRQGKVKKVRQRSKDFRKVLLVVP